MPKYLSFFSNVVSIVNIPCLSFGIFPEGCLFHTSLIIPMSLLTRKHCHLLRRNRLHQNLLQNEILFLFLFKCCFSLPFARVDFSQSLDSSYVLTLMGLYHKILSKSININALGRCTMPSKVCLVAYPPKPPKGSHQKPHQSKQS